MAHQDPVDPLSAFDALLRQELSVEPSNNLLPRVREQIRTEPAAAGWMGLWRLAPIAVATALVLAIGVFMLSNMRSADPSPVPIATAPTSAPRATVGKPPASSRQRTANSGQRTHLRASRYGGQATDHGQRTTDNGQRTAKDPEVIVDVRQREALQEFVRMINQGQLTAEKFKQTTPPPVDIAEAVTIIGVVPVSVSPIVVGGVLQGESERK